MINIWDKWMIKDRYPKKMMTIKEKMKTLSQFKISPKKQEDQQNMI